MHLEPCYKIYALILSKDSNSTILHQLLKKHQLLKNVVQVDFHRHPQKKSQTFFVLRRKFSMQKGG